MTKERNSNGQEAAIQVLLLFLVVLGAYWLWGWKAAIACVVVYLVLIGIATALGRWSKNNTHGG